MRRASSLSEQDFELRDPRFGGTPRGDLAFGPVFGGTAGGGVTFGFNLGGAAGRVLLTETENITVRRGIAKRLSLSLQQSLYDERGLPE